MPAEARDLEHFVKRHQVGFWMWWLLLEDFNNILKETNVLIYTKEYYLAIKRRKSCHLRQHGWTARVLMLSEISQTEKDKYCTVSLICRI